MAKKKKNLRPYVVGIGASAGGLEALRKLSSHIPTDSELCFVVAQHMSPAHRSIMAEILSKGANIDIIEATRKQPLKANTMYICPPNHHIFVNNQELVTEIATNTIGPKPSIDRLFASLAKELSDKCCGIILSGTGSDGAHGCRTLRASGALTIVQTPESAQYDAMPNAAIMLGAAELTLEAEEIGSKLSTLTKLSSADRQQSKNDSIEPKFEKETLLTILAMAKELTDIDFTRYKVGTINRQVDRRIAALQLSDIDTYAELLKNDESELRLLAQSFLISVTGFFRDTNAYSELTRQIQTIIKKRESFVPIRIWVAGCATGEEAYSIAMVVLESLKREGIETSVRIFATDVDEHALQFARRGVYSHAILDDVSRERIVEFFNETEQGFEVKKKLKDLVLFSKHNLASNPPFLRLSLVSCRNLLIYFNRDLQEQIIDVFNYSLNPDGILFLGNSETVLDNDRLFQQLGDQKLFRNKKSISKRTFVQNTENPSFDYHSSLKTKNVQLVNQYEKILHKSIIDEYGPPTALINGQDMVVELSGKTREFFSMAAGSTDLHVVKLIAEDFQPSLRTLLHRVRRSKEDGSSLVKVKSGEVFKLQVSNVKHVDEKLLLVSIVEQKVHQGAKKIELAKSTGEDNSNTEKDEIIAQLQEELSTTRTHLQMVVEDFETSNEELQAMTEEMQASSEELQASNEELATSNEELQATNEELRTVNDELTEKSDEINKINADLQNIHDAAGTGLVVLDSEMRIRDFNTAAIRILGLTKHDIGRTFSSLPIRISATTIVKELNKVISGHTQRTLFFDYDESYYKVELKPFYDSNNDIDGVVLSFIDVTDFEQQRRQLKQTSDLFSMLVDNRSLVFWVQEPKFGNIKYLSAGFKNVFGVEPQMVMRDPSYMLKVFDDESSANYLRQIRENSQDHWSIEISVVDPKTGKTKILQNSTFPVFKDGVVEHVIGLTYDNTENFINNKSLSSTIDLIYSLLQTSQDAVIAIDKKGKINFINSKAKRELDSNNNLLGSNVKSLLTSNEWEKIKSVLSSNFDQSKTLHRRITSKNFISEVVVSGCRKLLDLEDIQAIVVFRHDASSSILMKNLQLKAEVFDSIQEGIVLLDSATKCVSANKKAYEILGMSETALHDSVLEIFPRHPSGYAFNDDILKALDKSAYWTGDIHLPDQKGGFSVVETEIKQLLTNKNKTRANYIITLRDVTERHEYETTIHRQANFDSLTGLPNRVLFMDRLNHEIDVAKRDGTQFTLMFLDLDHFKTVNDTLGHETGDILLIEVADRVNKTIRNSDTFCRFGGDEFVLLMPKFHRKQAPEIFAKDLITSLEKPFIIEGQQLFISASVGIAIYPEDGADASELLANSDAAMYEAKREGRNGFVFHRNELNKDAKHRLQVETDLRNAVDRLDIIPFYQPVVDIDSGSIVGCEVLARWHHPDLGIVMPQEFIPHAESSGLINAITRSIMTIVMVDRSNLKDFEKISVAVNFSAKTLTKMSVKELFTFETKNKENVTDKNSFKLDLTGLTIEVTESIFLNSKNSNALTNLNWLKSHGAKIALDDFGTGYSALGYLRKYPIDVIKIDRSFIKDIASNSTDVALVKAAVEMAKGIGAELIAEGVETKDQQIILQALGLRYLQGYLYGKAMPFEAFVDCFKKSKGKETK